MTLIVYEQHKNGVWYSNEYELKYSTTLQKKYFMLLLDNCRKNRNANMTNNYKIVRKDDNVTLVQSYYS